LHADFDSLEWAKGNIRNEFSRSAGSEVQASLVFVGIFSPSKVCIPLLEEFVPSVFEGTLG
jgi:hypothetical protein